MLPQSGLYSFLDHKYGYTLHFLEGQKLVQDLAFIHPMQGQGFAYLRTSILSLVPMISFLKPKEGLGFYIDSESPYFRLKIELNASGTMRTLLLPEDFDQFPQAIWGKARLSKLLPEKQSYTSIIELADTKFEEVVNKILRESYQIPGQIIVAETSDQSLLLSQLPLIGGQKIREAKPIGPKEYYLHHRLNFAQVFEDALTDPEDIIKSFSDLGFTYLQTREVKLSCTCSKERMVFNLSNLTSTSKDELFEADSDELVVKCDYCKTRYVIKRDEIPSSKAQ